MPEAFPAEVLTLERKPSFARAIVPGTAIALAVFGFNLIGDGLRDLIDHRSDKGLF